MRPGEIYLARFPFGDIPGMKLRPVLLLTGAIGQIPEVLVAYISSVVPIRLLPSDLAIDPTMSEYAGSGLKSFSVLRLHKLATIHVSGVVRYLGQMERSGNVVIADKLTAVLGIG